MIRETESAQDRDLLRRFRAGDRDAFTALYRTHQACVYRFARSMTGDRMKAGEVTQDVFVWLIHHPDDFNPERGSLSGFLIGVARKFLKRRYSEEQRWVPLDEATAAPAGVDNGDADTERLRHAISALPFRYREVVALCGLEGKSYEEAAAIVDCAVGTVRSRMHRARALLARKLMGRGCTV
ncbi:MAG TPA: RNA polymerase sigma factor [Bryobacteraceae bacterium]|jgi:RNA polymerase sigma-70 factor (ECF subfamily)